MWRCEEEEDEAEGGGLMARLARVWDAELLDLGLTRIEGIERGTGSIKVEGDDVGEGAGPCAAESVDIIAEL